ncbi:hypothetical protein BH23CHL6_BH23CHL6_07430 [soil metagenome]
MSIEEGGPKTTDAGPCTAGHPRGRASVDIALVRASGLLRLAFPVLGAVALARGALLDVGFVTVALAISLIPWVIERTRMATLPGAAHLATVALPLAEATGRSLDLYEGHPIPYDVFAHAVEVGAVATIVLVVVRSSGAVAQLPQRPLAAVVIGGLTALAVGVGWEAIEAAVDPLFSGSLQHGFDDTAADVVAGTVGGLVAAVLVVLYWRQLQSDE